MTSCELQILAVRHINSIKTHVLCSVWQTIIVLSLAFAFYLTYLLILDVHIENVTKSSEINHISTSEPDRPCLFA